MLAESFRRLGLTPLCAAGLLALTAAACNGDGGDDPNQTGDTDGTDGQGDAGGTDGSDVDVVVPDTGGTDGTEGEDVTQPDDDDGGTDGTDDGTDGAETGTDGGGDADTGGEADTSLPPPVDTNIPEAELLLKIIGPPMQDTGRSHVAVQGGVTPITGIAFGSPEKITWESSFGGSGQAMGYPFWQTGAIPLQPGHNLVSVTATKGDKKATDTIHITYNPGFLFDQSPTVTPDALFVNEPTKAMVTIPITLYKSFKPSTVKVWRVDENGATIGLALESLVDNGKLGECDEIDQDGVFSACLPNLKCTDANDMWIAVSADVASDLATYTAFSAAVRVECAQRIGNSDCSGAQKALQDARAAWSAAGGTANPVAARDAAIASLKGSALVADAGPASGDGYGAWAEFKAGFLGALNLSPTDYRGGAGDSVMSMLGQLAAAESPANPFNTKKLASKKAVIMAPYHDQFAGQGGDEADEILTMMKASTCPTFAIETDYTLIGTSANLPAMRAQYLYGVTAITTHGDAYFQTLSNDAKAKYDFDHQGSQEILWTGEKANCSALSTTPKTCANDTQCPAGSQCAVTGGSAGSGLQGICVDYNQLDLRKGRVVLSDDTWGVAPTFVSRYAKRRFPNSLVYLGACRSLYNGTFGSEYLASGAKAVAGYAGYVRNPYAYATGKKFFEKMLIEGELTAGAWFGVESPEDPDVPGSYFRLFGAKNLDIMDADLINWSWETGDLTGWTAEGDGRVISKLGISIPVHGKFMGIISTGLGFTVQTGEIFQSFCIPADKSLLQFYWKFYSEEFKEWCGSIYQDTFQSTIYNDYGQLELVNTKVDDLCHYNDGSCAACPDPGVGACECGSQYVGLIPSDVVFDQGGVYNIQWQLSESIITSLAGEGPVTLKFFNTDQGDSIYDTVVLLDSVIFK